MAFPWFNTAVPVMFVADVEIAAWKKSTAWLWKESVEGDGPSPVVTSKCKDSKKEGEADDDGDIRILPVQLNRIC